MTLDRSPDLLLCCLRNQNVRPWGLILPPTDSAMTETDYRVTSAAGTCRHYVVSVSRREVSALPSRHVETNEPVQFEPSSCQCLRLKQMESPEVEAPSLGLLVILLSFVMAPVNKSAGQPDRNQLELKYWSKR